MARFLYYPFFTIFLCISTSAFGVNLQCSSFSPLLQDNTLERPRLPDCVSASYPFSHSYDFQNCKDQIEDYRSKLNSYLACLDSESKEAVSEYNQAVSAFNRRAQQ